MFGLRYSSRFRKDFKKILKNHSFKLKKFELVLNILIKEGDLRSEYNNHKLKGVFKNCLECHVQPDVLLIYKIDSKKMIISLLRIGSHSDLF